MKQKVRIELKKTKNYQSYTSSIECHIEFDSNEGRKNIINELYGQARSDISEQMRIDKQ